MNKRGDYVMPSWAGKLIIMLIIGALLIALIVIIIGPKATQVTQEDIIYRIMTMSFGDRGVTGAIADPSTVVCFGGGSDKTVHCLKRDAGKEVFAAKLLTKDGYAMSKPALVSDGIIVGFGRFVCKYNLAGDEDWCMTLTDQVTSNIAVDNKDDANITCFESGKLPSLKANMNGGKMICLDAKTGDFKFSVSTDADKVVSTPTIDKSKNAVYFGLGKRVYRYALDRQGLFEAGDGKAVWLSDSYAHNMVTGIALGEGKVCFGAMPSIYCLNEGDGSEYLNIKGKSGWNSCSGDGCVAESTPLVYNKSLYFGLGKTLCKYGNITAANGTQENCAGANWTVDYSTPIMTKVVVAIMPPISGVSFGNETLVCTGNGGDKKIACVWDYGNSTAPFVSLEGKWDDCPKFTQEVQLLGPTVKISVGDPMCIADSTPVLSKDMLYYALGNKVCATNLTSLDITGELTLDKTSSKPAGGIAKWCVMAGSSDLNALGDSLYVPSITDLETYDVIKLVAQPMS